MFELRATDLLWVLVVVSLTLVGCGSEAAPSPAQTCTPDPGKSCCKMVRGGEEVIFCRN
jgi:hypothetical protein